MHLQSVCRACHLRAIQSVQVSGCLCVLLILILILLLPHLAGGGVTELCGDIFQDHLPLLQNGQECVQ